MIRFVVILLASVLLISLLRAIMGVIMKGFADLVGGGTAAARQPQQPPAQVPLGGELRKDPVCGTYVSTTASIQKTVGGQTLYFCSLACRDKYKA